VERFAAWLRSSTSILGPRRTMVTLILSAIAAGIAVWWSLGGVPLVLQVLAGLVITGGLMVFFVWVEADWLSDEGDSQLPDRG
jgi:hypothetical protein